MPRGFQTEDGPRPDLAELYGAREHTGGYRARTLANLRDADALLWFGSVTTPGARLTLGQAAPMGLTICRVDDGLRPSNVLEWLEIHRPRVLMVAGNRESKAPGIGARVEAFLGRILIHPA